MNRFIKIGEALKILGVSIQTLRLWEETDYLVPDRISQGKTRYYDLNHLMGKKILEKDLTIAYARVLTKEMMSHLKKSLHKMF